MWAEVFREAVDDVGAPGVEASVAGLDVVHCMSWVYDDPAQRLADRLGLDGVRTGTSILAGTAPQRLLDESALRILRGDSDVEVVVGAEAAATRHRHQTEGGLPDWSFPADEQPEIPVDLDEWYLPTELAHGVVPAYVTFALLEQARWADHGGPEFGRGHLTAVLDELNARAADVPEAWIRERRSGAELLQADPSNRHVSYPYTVRTTAMPRVDMAAANVLVAHEQADRWGVPPERRLYLRGWGFARDAVHVAARRDLGSSAGMAAATGQAFQMSGLSVGDVDVFDLYSCFGSAVQFAVDALGLDPADPRPLTVTGGLPYHGGPGSNYTSHSLSHLVTEVREGRAATGLITGVGMHMTKHVAALWSVEPGPIAVPLTDGPQRYGPDDSELPVVADSATGVVRLRSATTVRMSASDEPFAVVIAELDDGRRCYARSSSAGAVAMVEEDAWPGAAVQVRPAGPVNELLV